MYLGVYRMICMTLITSPPLTTSIPPPPVFRLRKDTSLIHHGPFTYCVNTRLCRLKPVIDRLTLFPRLVSLVPLFRSQILHIPGSRWSLYYFPSSKPSNEPIVESLGAGQGSETLHVDIHLPLHTLPLKVFFFFSFFPLPPTAPRYFTRVRGWPGASMGSGMLIPLGQRFCLPFCTLPPASEQPWTGFSLASCSLCYFSSRTTEFMGLHLSQEVSKMVHSFAIPPLHTQVSLHQENVNATEEKERERKQAGCGTL